jgi:ribonuclease E
MLFNATHSEELRVAIVDGQKLVNLDIESATRAERKGNIYKGRITRIEPSLEAAFVDYGTQRQGFLPFKEISRSEFKNISPETPMAQVKIQEAVSEGQEFLIQVEKDERGNKGAALTTFISLAGRYLVLMPNNPKGGGISRRIAGDERTELRENLIALKFPAEHSLIARTAGIGKSRDELQWDLDFLLQLWAAIESATVSVETPYLMYQESNLIVRAIRDYLRGDIQEILVDQEDIYNRAQKFMQQVMPHNVSKLKHYQDAIPLFSRFQIEHQIEDAYARTVRLSSGGSLVIDHTEALVTIDVNSARATRGSDIEETALQTNLEAVDEIARQLRIRDLGGLAVLDLIDMTSSQNNRLVENRLQEAVKLDRARIQTGRISRFGILELSRQRLRSSISDANYTVCPHCEGTGHLRKVTSSALSLLRIIEEEALKENTEAVYAELPIETATFLLNEKRPELNQIETRLGTRIVVLPSPHLDGRQFRIRRLRSEDLDKSGEIPSHKIKLEGLNENEDTTPHSSTPQNRPSNDPAVKMDQVATTQPPRPKQHARNINDAPKLGVISRVWKSLFGNTEVSSSSEKTAESPAKRPRTPESRPSRSGRSGNRYRGQNRGRRSSGQQNANEERSASSDQRPRGRGRGRSQTGGGRHRSTSTTSSPRNPNSP